MFLGFLIMLYLMNALYSQLRRDAAQRGQGATADGGRLRADVDELIVELRHAAEQINTDITSRAATLQKLVEEADEKLRRLDGAVGRVETQRHATQAAARGAATAAPRRTLPPSEPPRPRTAARPAGARPQPGPPTTPVGGGTSAGRTADETWPGAPAGPPVRTVPPVQTGSPAAARAYGQAARATSEPGFVETKLEDAAKFQTVRRLAQEGLTAAEIARRTQLEREEVELIMQLAAGS